MIFENKLIVIAFIPRSGSNYFCDMLLRVDLGLPLEYYYPYDFEERIKFWDSKTSEVEHIDKNLVPTKEKWFLEVSRRGSVKCTWDAHEVMLKECGSIVQKFDLKYIYLKRRDKLRQAISWYRADFSDRWTAGNRHASSNEPKNLDPLYDRDSIQERLDWIVWQEAQWDEYLKDIDRLELFYEDLCYDTITRYEEFTGFRRQRDRDLDSAYTIMRDELTEEWVKLFRSHR